MNVLSRKGTPFKKVKMVSFMLYLTAVRKFMKNKTQLKMVTYAGCLLNVSRNRKKRNVGVNAVLFVYF